MNTITKILIVAVIGIVILFTNVLSFNGDNLVLQFPSIQFFLEFLASQNFVILVGIFGFFFMFYMFIHDEPKRSKRWIFTITFWTALT
jgi:uncharacterized BrkB/YihY/UPF0761 family membrane protein